MQYNANVMQIQCKYNAKAVEVLWLMKANRFCLFLPAGIILSVCQKYWPHCRMELHLQYTQVLLVLMDKTPSTMVLEKTCLADCDFRKWSRHSAKVTSKTFFCRPSLMAITLSIVVSGKRAEFFAVRTLSWSVCWELNKNPDVCFSADFSTQTMARGRFWPGFDDLRAFSWGRT